MLHRLRTTTSSRWWGCRTRRKSWWGIQRAGATACEAREAREYRLNGVWWIRSKGILDKLSSTPGNRPLHSVSPAYTPPPPPPEKNNAAREQ